MTTATIGIKPTFGYDTTLFRIGNAVGSKSVSRPVLRDLSAMSSDIAGNGCCYGDFDRWVDAEAARRIANDNGNRTSFDDVMRELGLSSSDLEPVEIETEW